MDHLAFCEWGGHEYCRGLTAIIMPRDSRRFVELRRAFAALLLGRPIFPFNSARAGLAMALRVFKCARPHANEVIVPSYICPAVIATICASGLCPVAVDIDQELNLDTQSLEALISPRTLAVLAAHMYGCPARIRETEAICRRHQTFLVDDSAQVAGVSLQGQPLGTFGDIGIISFGQSKTIVAGSHNAGGLLVVNNRDLEPQIAEIYATLPEAPACVRDFLMFVSNCMLPQGMELCSYYFDRIFWRGKRLSRAKFETATKISKLGAALALEQLKSLQSRVAGRKRIAELYHRSVAAQQMVGFPQYAQGRYLTRVMLTLPRGADLTAIRASLRAKGIRTRTGYPIFAPHSGLSPRRASDLQPRLIELPSHSNMSAETVERIWGQFRASLSACEMRSADQGGLRHGLRAIA